MSDLGIGFVPATSPLGGSGSLTIVTAAGVTPVDTDVSSQSNNSSGIIVGTGGRIFQFFKNATDVYYVELTEL